VGNEPPSAPLTVNNPLNRETMLAIEVAEKLFIVSDSGFGNLGNFNSTVL
jgi:hypothetical protein